MALLFEWITKKAANKATETIVEPIKQTLIRKTDERVTLYSKIGKVLVMAILCGLAVKQKNDDPYHHSDLNPSQIVINNYICERRKDTNGET